MSESKKPRGVFFYPSELIPALESLTGLAQSGTKLAESSASLVEAHKAALSGAGVAGTELRSEVTKVLSSVKFTLSGNFDVSVFSRFLNIGTAALVFLTVGLGFWSYSLYRHVQIRDLELRFAVQKGWNYRNYVSMLKTAWERGEVKLVTRLTDDILLYRALALSSVPSPTEQSAKLTCPSIRNSNS